MVLHFKLARKNELRHRFELVLFFVLIVGRVRLENPGHGVGIGVVGGHHLNKRVEKVARRSPKKTKYRG